MNNHWITRMAVLWENFRMMPFILKLLTLHAAGCLLSLVAIFPLGISYKLYDKEIGYVEFWASGMAITAISIGILLPLSAYLMLMRHKIARKLYLGSNAFLLMMVFVLEAVHGRNLTESLLAGAIFYGLLVAYFYLRGPVKAYFVEGLDSFDGI